MTRKDNNINQFKSNRFLKGLSLLILLFFVGNIFSQKIFKNSIVSKSKEIYIEFDIIDHIELVVSDKADVISVVAQSENVITQDFILEEKNGIVFIKGIKNYFENEGEKNDKFCSIQPIYTSYKIEIPPNKGLNVLFSKGNFYSNSFRGKLNLKLNDGIIRIDDFKGEVGVEINGGRVYCSEMENVNIDVKSNQGFVTTELLVSGKNSQINEFKQLFGNKINELNVRAISANIHLKAK